MMEGLLLVCLLLYLPYLLFFIQVWSKWSKRINASAAKPHLTFSIIIPARNEAKKLPHLLQDLQNQRYPTDRFEVIVVDDNSEDDTAALAKSCGVNVITMTDKGIEKAHKKAALSAGIASARFDYIITTDADCRVQPQWLSAINSFLEKTNADIAAAPVLIHSSKNLLQKLLALEASGMAVITGAMIKSKWLHLSNGANLIFRKSAFLAVGGYAGVDHVASGDDMLLMGKLKKQYKADFIGSPEAVVFTDAPQSLNELLHQRVRWVGKFSKAATPVSFAFVLIYLLFLLIPVFVAVAFLNPLFWIWALILMLGLAIPLFTTIHLGKGFLPKSNASNLLFSVSIFLLAFLFYTGYVLLIGPISLFLKPEWKGRKV